MHSKSRLVCSLNYPKNAANILTSFVAFNLLKKASQNWPQVNKLLLEAHRANAIENPSLSRVSKNGQRRQASDPPTLQIIFE